VCVCECVCECVCVSTAGQEDKGRRPEPHKKKEEKKVIFLHVCVQLYDLYIFIYIIFWSFRVTQMFFCSFHSDINAF